MKFLTKPSTGTLSRSTCVLSVLFPFLGLLLNRICSCFSPDISGEVRLNTCIQTRQILPFGYTPLRFVSSRPNLLIKKGFRAQKPGRVDSAPLINPVTHGDLLPDGGGSGGVSGRFPRTFAKSFQGSSSPGCVLVSLVPTQSTMNNDCSATVHKSLGRR